MTHFTQDQFWYLLSRNRSTCGVRPYIRATTNPDADSWVRQMIAWWLTEEGQPDPEKAGVIRYFVRKDGELLWSDEPIEDGKSFTFIPASVFDNPALLAVDRGYLANLKALPAVDRDRLLGGNWNVRAAAGKVYKLEWFTLVDNHPPRGRFVRFWDFAGTVAKVKGDDPDWTAGVKMFMPDGDNQPTYVVDVVCEMRSPAGVDQLIQAVASQDGRACAVRWYQDPGQAGVYQTSKLRELLRGYDAVGVIDPLDKLQRAKPLAAALEYGEVLLMRGDWNQGFINELVSFPDGKHDDRVDAAAGAYNHLIGLNLREFKTSQYRS